MCVKKLGWVVLTADSKPSYTVIETVIRTSSFSGKSYIVGISKGKLSTGEAKKRITVDSPSRRIAKARRPTHDDTMPCGGIVDHAEMCKTCSCIRDLSFVVARE